MTERRRVHLLIPDGDGTRLAVDADGRVPVLDLEFDAAHGLTTGAALDAALRGLTVASSIVEYVIDQTTDDTFEGPIEVVAEVDVRDLPPGWRWAPRVAVSTDAAPSLQPYVDARMAEWGGAPVPAQRAPWARRGWQADLRAWIDEQLLACDGVMADDVTPFRLWGISAVFRVDTPVGLRWAKAVFPGFAAEPAITATLARLRPGSVARVLAIDEVRGWLLLDHVPGTPVATQIDRTDHAIRSLVALQRSLTGCADELLAAGAGDRSIGRLPEHLERALDCATALDMRRSVDDGRVVAAVQTAVAEVESLGVPATLVHGDFHPSNVMVDGEHIVIFDWSDAAWSHPLVDVGAWAAWYRDDPATVDRLWATWADAWGLDSNLLVGARPALDVVVAAYHVVSYVHIAEGLEPLRVGEAVGAVQRFLDDLETAISRR
jgi:hypothetical protein